jgi:hypothetical protein
MKKLIALALSSAIITLPAAADAQSWHHGGDWGGRYYSYHRHHDGFRHFRYRNYGFGYAYPRTVFPSAIPRTAITAATAMAIRPTPTPHITAIRATAMRPTATRPTAMAPAATRQRARLRAGLPAR